MTTVGELFHTVDRDEVIAAILRLYPYQPGDHPDGYLRAWDILFGKEAMTPTTMVCELYTATSFDDPPETFISVHGREPGDEAAYAIEYNPWSEWLSMEVNVLPECGDIPRADLLAHIFWEMTWAGYDDNEVADQKQEILDRVEEVKEMIDSETPPRT